MVEWYVKFRETHTGKKDESRRHRQRQRKRESIERKRER